MKTLRQDRSEFNVLFVHSELDDYGLDAQEFRIYAHLARRANGKNRAYPGITSMSESCRMNRHTVMRAINSLEERGLIRISKKSGALNEYILTSPSEWKKSNPSTGASLGTGALNDTGTETDTGAQVGTGARMGTRVVPETILPPVLKEALKGNPREGNPLKDNTVDDPPKSSNGSVTATHHAALSENHSNGTSHSPSAQTPIQRKAYAVATRLQTLHWDNCKVKYSLHPSRAYAEEALLEGHDEKYIIGAYGKALHYCHGVITDEINRGERLQHEKATCALTVTLAAENLCSDSKTATERWGLVIQRLQEECRRQQIEEAQIVEQIAQASPSIAAWFARNGSADEMKLEPAP